MTKDAKVIFISNNLQLNIIVAKSSLMHFVELYEGCNKLLVNFIHLPKATYLVTT